MSAPRTNGKSRTPAEVRHEGMRALLERLGPGDTIRFLHAHDMGEGDYTAERHQWLDRWTIDEAIRAIAEHEKSAGKSK